jgi:DNA-binding XRE family transcriptional regulator
MASFRPLASCGRQQPAVSNRDVSRRDVCALMNRLHRAGWTQLEMAVALGVAERTIRNWRSGDLSHESYLDLLDLAEREAPVRKVGT